MFPSASHGNTTSKKMEQLFETSNNFSINFNLKSNCGDLLMERFDFIEAKYIDVLDSIKSQEVFLEIKYFEEANYEVVFKAKECVPEKTSGM